MTNKRALLVGIDQYHHSYIKNLEGCVNDVSLFKSVLEGEFGFASANIRVLTNGMATRNAILGAFDQLAAETQENDIVVFHYSGHGSQMTDVEGDEPDGKDETLVAHDSGRSMFGDDNRDIKDDEIALFIKTLNEKTPYVTLIFDSCHSGTISRDGFGDMERWAEGDVVSADDPAYADHIAHLPPPLEIDVPVSRAVGASGWLPKSEKYVLLAGCRDEEKSYEHRTRSGTKHGIFTFNLCQELLKATPDTSYATVFERASASVTAYKAVQHPQMEGARNRQLFGARQVAKLRYIGVEKRSGEQVTLRGGAAHGLAVGSQWAIYPPEVNEVTENTPRLGLVEITTVRAVSADAIVLPDNSGNHDAIQAGCRAVAYAHNYGEMILTVALNILAEGQEEQVAQMRQIIEDSPLMRVVDGEESADCCLYLLPPRTEVRDNTPVPQLGGLQATTWVAVTRDGQHQSPHPVSTLSAWQIFDNLEKLARFQMAWSLKNEMDGNPLVDVVTALVKRKSPQGNWESYAEDDPMPTFYDGDLLGMMLANGSRRQSVFVTVLGFGAGGSIYQLYPIEGASEELKPRQQIEFGVAEEDLELYIPEEVAQDVVDDRLKIIITSGSADFSHLVQEGWRGISVDERGNAATSPIEELLTLALTGTGTRNVRRRRNAKVDQWITQERQFTLTRR